MLLSKTIRVLGETQSVEDSSIFYGEEEDGGTRR